MFEKLTPGDDTDDGSCPSLQSCWEEYRSRKRLKYFVPLQLKKS